jgi:hypothetical protein
MHNDQGLPPFNPNKQIIAIQQIPLRVSAAFRAIETLHGMRFIPSNDLVGSAEFRNFSPSEMALWNASLEIVRLYISGENDFRDVHPKELRDGQGDLMYPFSGD